MKYLFLTLVLLASPAWADVIFEAGPAFLSNARSGAVLIVISERSDKWDLGIGWVDKQTVFPDWERDRGLPEVSFRENLFIHATRVGHFKKLEFGLGAAYFQNTNRALGKNFNVSAYAGYNFNKAWSIRYRHFSSAGSGVPNMGQDGWMIGLRL